MREERAMSDRPGREGRRVPLRRLSGEELTRYLIERQRAYYVFIGSPYGMRDEDFERWLHAPRDPLARPDVTA
jgi:hypothetical protein